MASGSPSGSRSFDQRRQPALDVAADADRVGLRERRPVLGARVGDRDADRGGLADGVEHVGRAVRERRRPREVRVRLEPQRRQARRADDLGHRPSSWRRRVLGEAHQVALGVEVVGEHVDDDRRAGAGVDRVVDHLGGPVGLVRSDELDGHRRRGLGAVAVDDRVAEPVAADEPGSGRVAHGRRRHDRARAVAGRVDRRDEDRLAIRVVVVGGHGDADRRPGAGPDLVVDRDGRIVDAVVVRLARQRVLRLLVGHGHAVTHRGLVVDDHPFVAQQGNRLVVLADRPDAPWVDRPHHVAGDVVDPHQVGRRRDLEGRPCAHRGHDVVEAGARSPVEAHDLGRRPADHRRRVTSDRELIGAVDPEVGDGDGLLHAVIADTPELVVGAHPRALRGRPRSLQHELAAGHVGVDAHPPTSRRPQPGSGAVEHDRSRPDEGELGARYTEVDRVDRPRRRGADEVLPGHRPHRAVRSDQRLRSGVDGERDLLPRRGHHGTLRGAGVHDHQALRADAGDRVRALEQLDG